MFKNFPSFSISNGFGKSLRSVRRSHSFNGSSCSSAGSILRLLNLKFSLCDNFTYWPCQIRNGSSPDLAWGDSWTRSSLWGQKIQIPPKGLLLIALFGSVLLILSSRQLQHPSSLETVRIQPPAQGQNC
jgi:hypothetical protein